MKQTMHKGSTNDAMSFTAERAVCPMIQIRVPGFRRPLKALCDSGAEDNFITEKCAMKLWDTDQVRMSRRKIQTRIEGIGGMSLRSRLRVGLEIEDPGALHRERTEPLDISCITVPNIRTGHTECDLILGIEGLATLGLQLRFFRCWNKATCTVQSKTGKTLVSFSRNVPDECTVCTACERFGNKTTWIASASAERQTSRRTTRSKNGHQN